MGVNGQKLNFQVNGGRWWDDGVETAWNSLLSMYNIVGLDDERIRSKFIVGISV